MDLTKIVYNMFTSRGKDGHTWPRSMLKSGRSHLCAQGLNFQHKERPEILRLNSTGDTASVEDYTGEARGFIKKGILGDFTPSRFPAGSLSAKNLDQMPCWENTHQRAKPCPMGSTYRSGWLTREKNSPGNGYNFNMAQRHYRYPAFGAGYLPIPPWQQYGNGWTYPPWMYGGHGSLLGNPFGGNGYPMGYAAYHQGMPVFANAYHRSSPSQLHRKNTQNMRSQEKGKCGKKSIRRNNNKREQVVGSGDTESASTVSDKSDVGDIVHTLNELHITSEKCDSQSDISQEAKTDSKVPLKMFIKMHGNDSEKANSPNVMNGQSKEKKDDIPSLQKKVCDNCEKCASKVDCMGIGYCLLNPSNGSAKLTLILGNKENMGNLSNAKGKNGYHEKNVNKNDPSDSDHLSDETVPSQSLNDHLHHDNVGDISSSHSPAGSKPKCNQASTPSNSYLVAQVLLQRNSSSKRRPGRPSARKRHKVKERQSTVGPSLTSEANKKQKVNHREVPSTTTTASNSQPCNTIAYILGISQKQDDAQSVTPDSTDNTHIHCKVSVQPDRFSFTISSSEDTDFSDDEDEVTTLSEDDADIWNSFCKYDDPYNPMNFLTCTSTSTPKGIPKSNSAPSLLSPEVLQNDDVWKKDTPPFSPPKPEALTRVAKKVHFATDASMVQVHTADDWERKGPWEQMALDSQRFQKRIKRTDETIGYIFTEKHRQHILEQLALLSESGTN